MMSDGQLYNVRHKGEVIPPPDVSPTETACEKPLRGLKLSFKPDDLIIIGILILLLSDKCEPDIPLILALAYILIS